LFLRRSHPGDTTSTSSDTTDRFEPALLRDTFEPALWKEGTLLRLLGNLFRLIEALLRPAVGGVGVPREEELGSSVSKLERILRKEEDLVRDSSGEQPSEKEALLRGAVANRSGGISASEQDRDDRPKLLVCSDR
jgi:hypothetical protein